MSLLGFFRAIACLLVLICVFAAVSQIRPASVPIPKFVDVAKEIGITMPHISSAEKRYIVESMSGGAGLIDCDNDGKLDIITVNGSTVERYKAGGDPMIT